MTTRRASSTAVLVCQGRAVADGRLGVGRFADPVAVRLLDPAEREVVERVRAGRVEGSPWGLPEEMLLRTAATIVPRTVAIDDTVRDHAASQVVVLGAGLDSRAWRMVELAGVSVFEVDHPASQADKQRRVGGLEPVAGRVVPVAVDLAADPLAGALLGSGFDRTAPTTWVWEGVVPYLDEGSVRRTVEAVAGLSARGSRFVVQYQARSVVASAMRRVVRVVLRATRQPDPLAGEPWRSQWTPAGIADLLSDNGFGVSWDADLVELSSGLRPATDSGGSLRNGRVAVAEKA